MFNKRIVFHLYNAITNYFLRTSQGLIAAKTSEWVSAATWRSLTILLINAKRQIMTTFVLVYYILWSLFFVFALSFWRENITITVTQYNCTLLCIRNPHYLFRLLSNGHVEKKKTYSYNDRWQQHPKSRLLYSFVAMGTSTYVAVIVDMQIHRKTLIS